jgi:hypothetical protein
MGGFHAHQKQKHKCMDAISHSGILPKPRNIPTTLGQEIPGEKTNLAALTGNCSRNLSINGSLGKQGSFPQPKD